MKNQLPTLSYHFHYYKNNNVCKNIDQLQSSLHVPGIYAKCFAFIILLKMLRIVHAIQGY